MKNNKFLHSTNTGLDFNHGENSITIYLMKLIVLYIKRQILRYHIAILNLVHRYRKQIL